MIKYQFLDCNTNSLIFIFTAEEIPVIYELAVKQHPKNEEFLSHLFMSYVRIGNYKKQQQVKFAVRYERVFHVVTA